MNKKLIFIGLFLFSLSIGSLLIPPHFFAEESPALSAEQRPAHWAQPLDRPGLPNLHKVSPLFYRSAQPDAGGMAELKKMGIRSVVNLRSRHSDKEIMEGSDLQYVSLPMNAWKTDEEDAVRFLKIFHDAKNTPILLHCKHGADRTGSMTAVYRVAVCGWSKKEALSEMTRGGFGFHSAFKNLIRFIEKLDVDSVRRKSGISSGFSKEKMQVNK